MKQAKQQAPKASGKKKTLSELCQERIHNIHDAKREKEEAARQARHRAQEDEMMALMYGPNWRTKQLPFDPPRPEPPPAVRPGVPQRSAREDYEDPYYDDDFPDSKESNIRLKAS